MYARLFGLAKITKIIELILDVIICRLKTLYTIFIKDERANVAMMFGLLAVPLVLMLGGAVDFMRFNRHKTQLMSAMDSAALALGQRPAMSNADAVTFVTDYVENMVEHGDGTMFVIDGFTVTKTLNGFEVKSDAAMETAFLPLIGIPEMELDFSTAIENTTNRIELALALDNTGSMRSNGKIQALRDAATILVDVMYEADRANERVNIGLVPFVTTVNINDSTTTGTFRQSWIDVNGNAKHNGENFNPGPNPNHHSALFAASGVPWKGCVEARAEPFDTDMTPPGGSADTLFVPFFSPDMDENMRDFQNSYIRDSRFGPPPHVVQRDARRYYTQQVRNYDHPRDGYGPNRGCPRPLVNLTNDTDMLHQEIDAMEGWSGGGTNIAMGAFWAWNLLDPDEPFSDGQPFTDKETVKAMVLLTDGENVITNPGGSTDNSTNFNGSDYTGYGFLLKNGKYDGRDRGRTSPENRGQSNRLNANDNVSAAQAVDTKVEEMCTKIKASKIRLYTITFQLNGAGQQYLRDLFEECASSDGFGGKLYFNSPDNATLQEIFRDIARDLSSLRIVR